MVLVSVAPALSKTLTLHGGGFLNLGGYQPVWTLEKACPLAAAVAVEDHMGLYRWLRSSATNLFNKYKYLE